MKKLLVALAVLGFGMSSQAELEIQMSGSFAGTNGDITMSEIGPEGANTSNTTSWGLGAEVYMPMSENLQIGGVFGVADSGVSGSDTTFGIGVIGRYNLDTNLRDSMFINLGLAFNDLGWGDYIGVLGGFGKRYALSDTITYTPNVEIVLPVSGDLEGHQIRFNIFSFSGFM